MKHPLTTSPAAGRGILAELANTPLALSPAGWESAREILAAVAAGSPLAAQAGRKSPQARRTGLVGLVGLLFPRGNFLTDMGYGTALDGFTAAVRDQAADPGIDRIVIVVDSPGGSVDGVEEAAAAVRDARKAKPVVAAVDSTAASAAYWIAAQASEVAVTLGGRVGSIGVFNTHVDVSKALEKSGEAVTLVYAGERKVDGNPYEPLSDRARVDWQRSVDAYYDTFVRDVAKGRGVTPGDVRAGFGRGGMVLARDAVRERMADRVATLDEVLSGVRSSTGGATAAAATPAPPAAKPVNPGVETRKRRLLLDQSIAAQRRQGLEQAERAAQAVSPDLVHTAHHEAGHAVVAYLLGDRGFTATVVPTADYRGAVHPSVNLFHTDRAAMLYAGHAGGLLSPHPAADGRWVISSRDEEQAREACPDQERRQRARHRAGELVHAHAAAVRDVAAQLLARRTIGAADVGAAIAKFPPTH